MLLLLLLYYCYYWFIQQPVSYTHLDVYKRQAINNHTRLNTILNSNDQVNVEESEGDLLGKLPSVYGMEIFTFKTKIMAFRGKDSVRSKTIVNGPSIEQVSHFR